MDATTNATSRTIDIDGMTGDVCIQKINAALKGVRNVSVQSVKVGQAIVRADQAGCTEARSAIGKAGFTAREHADSGPANGTPHAHIPADDIPLSPASDSPPKAITHATPGVSVLTKPAAATN